MKPSEFAKILVVADKHLDNYVASYGMADLVYGSDENALMLGESLTHMTGEQIAPLMVAAVRRLAQEAK